MVPPRLPDTLLQVYHRRRPTLGLLILPSVPSFSPTIRRTARIICFAFGANSCLKRARIFSDLLPFLTVAQRARGQLHTILEDMDHYPNACLEELEAFMTLWDVKPRVEESSLETLSMDELITQLRQICEDAEDHVVFAQDGSTDWNSVVIKALAAATVTHAASTQEENNLRSNSSQNKACNYKEFRAVMHENFRGTEGAVGLTRWFEKLESQFGISNVAEGDRVKFASSTLLDGALTWWNVYVRSVTLDTAHATPWSDFKAMFIRKYCPRNEIKQMENELWNLKVKGTNLTAYNQRF
ncbi:reverse transcriptase domain-containing protein [Tanacetum coccineum]